KPVVDFHHQVITHAGRTNKKPKRHSHSGFFDPSTLLVKEPLFLDFELVLLYKKNSLGISFPNPNNF
ncbi:MAG: hypothetical protein RR439_04770, partial [Carnobacterium sp.]